MTWDPEGRSRRFKFTADDAHNYCREIGPKMLNNRTYQTLYDERFAEAYLYDQLYHSAMLETREKMLEGLRQMLESYKTAFDPGANDVYRYREAYRDHIQKLLNEFDQSE